MEAAVALLNRARTHLSLEDLLHYVGPSDPGWIESLGQMWAILQDGEVALEDSIDHEPLSDAISEWERSLPSRFLWYRLMAASAAVLCDDDMIEMSAHYHLARILADTWQLKELGHQDDPVDLVPAICRELAAKPIIFSPELRVFALLGELLTAGFGEAPSEHVVALCSTFEQEEQAFSLSGDYSSPEYLWGLTNFDSYHPLWLRLVHEHFPTNVQEATTIRDSLLEHGERWMGAGPKETSIDDSVGDSRPEQPFDASSIAFFLTRTRSERGRKVALRLADDYFRLCPKPSDDQLESWLSAINNAIHSAHGSADHELTAHWAEIAMPYARQHRFLPHNLACAFAALGRMDDAFAMCTIAVETGATDFATLKKDEDLGKLRQERRFKALARK